MPAAKRNTKKAADTRKSSPSKQSNLAETSSAIPERRILKLSAAEFHTRCKPLLANAAAGTAGRGPLAALEKIGLLSPIVVVGEEPYRVRRFVSWLRETLIPVTSRTAPTERGRTYFGSELTSNASITPILHALSAPSLFCAASEIIIYDFDKLKAAVMKPLVAAISSPSNCAFVILTTTASKDRESEQLSRGTIVDIGSLQGTSLIRWIEREAVTLGATGGIETEAAELLAYSFDNHLSLLAQELGKLALLTEPGQKISLELTRSMLTHAPERTSFELVNRVAERDVPGSVKLVSELLDQGLHPLQLSSFLSRCVRTMLASRLQSGEDPARRAYMASAKSKSSSSGELSNPWFVRNLSRAVSRFGVRDLERALELLKKLDLQLKSSKLSPPVVTSLAIQQLATRRFA